MIKYMILTAIALPIVFGACSAAEQSAEKLQENVNSRAEKLEQLEDM